MSLSRHPGPLRSRFGRRLLFLFIGSTVLPTAVVAILSYRQVTQYLVSHSETSLHQASKAFGAAIFERLLMLDATLKNVAAGQTLAAALRAESTVPNVDPSATGRFTALEFVGTNGRRVALVGGLTELPLLSKRDSADLRDGLPLLTARHAEQRATRTFILRRVSPSLRDGRQVEGLLIGEIEPDYLWATSDQSLISAGTILTVRDDSAHVLVSSVTSHATPT